MSDELIENHHGGVNHHHGGVTRHTHSNDDPDSHDLQAHNARMKSDSEYLKDTVVPVEHDLDYFQVRITGLLRVLKDKGIVSTDEMRRVVEEIYSETPTNGARVVARSWVDSDFKERLLNDAHSACGELGIDTSDINKLIALENTDSTHYMVVCTLCSCYPRPLLGQPPIWYKSFPYRSKAVTDPRGALLDLGYTPPEGIEVVVIDSNADCRYLVVPRRPAGTEQLSEDALVKLITRDSMIGVADALTPEENEKVVVD